MATTDVLRFVGIFSSAIHTGNAMPFSRLESPSSRPAYGQTANIRCSSFSPREPIQSLVRIRCHATCFSRDRRVEPARAVQGQLPPRLLPVSSVRPGSFPVQLGESVPQLAGQRHVHGAPAVGGWGVHGEPGALYAHVCRQERGRIVGEGGGEAGRGEEGGLRVGSAYEGVDWGVGSAQLCEDSVPAGRGAARIQCLLRDENWHRNQRQVEPNPCTLSLVRLSLVRVGVKLQCMSRRPMFRGPVSRGPVGCM